MSAEADTPLLRMLGALDFGPRRDVPTLAANLRTAGVPHEEMPAAEAARRWPGMRFEGDVLFHAQAGTLDADAAVTAMLGTAARHGATVRHEVAGLEIRRTPGGVEIDCSDGSVLEAGSVVVATGAWAGALLDGLLRLPPLRVTRQDVFHFPRAEPASALWPSVIHEGANAFYHLAGGRDGGGQDDRKIGVHDIGRAAAAGEVAEVDASTRAFVADYVRAWLPGLEPTPRSETTCLYTRTPSEDFLLDRVGPIVVCSPCSGHGAKFAPLVGEYVADLVEGHEGVPERFSFATHRRGVPGAASL